MTLAYIDIEELKPCPMRIAKIDRKYMSEGIIQTAIAFGVQANVEYGVWLFVARNDHIFIFRSREDAKAAMANFETWLNALAAGEQAGYDMSGMPALPEKG